MGLGLTSYGVYRGQRTRNELTFQAVEADGRSIAVSGVTDFDYCHYRTLAKLGLAWQTTGWNAGLSVTTPEPRRFRQRQGRLHGVRLGKDANGDGRPDAPFLRPTAQEDLTTDYRSSWAVGLGASRRLGNTRLYASAEWYAAVDRFAVIDAAEPTRGMNRLSQELRSVLTPAPVRARR